MVLRGPSQHDVGPAGSEGDGHDQGDGAQLHAGEAVLAAGPCRERRRQAVETTGVGPGPLHIDVDVALLTGGERELPESHRAGVEEKPGDLRRSGAVGFVDSLTKAPS